MDSWEVNAVGKTWPPVSMWRGLGLALLPPASAVASLPEPVLLSPLVLPLHSASLPVAPVGLHGPVLSTTRNKASSCTSLKTGGCAPGRLPLTSQELLWPPLLVVLCQTFLCWWAEGPSPSPGCQRCRSSAVGCVQLLLLFNLFCRYRSSVVPP